ncbi:serine/threonine-protein kinase GL21140 [Onthophagus taurus]|uniref:serine/threonine-protein kinase GL21140 n=1 Tax=Onthophagus taurus TaxID=166361 RepID=UPI000C2043A9|nr:serine/threonine-protein kinase GL21140 [Onthophagus taurus]
MSKNNINGSRSVSSASCNSCPSDADDSLNNGIGGLSISNDKRPSSTSSRTQKARRIKFYHNGNKFFGGVIVPVGPDRYRSFESLMTELTAILSRSVTLPSGVRSIYTVEGKKVSTIDELEDGKDYVCGGKNEQFKKLEYCKIDQNKPKRTSTSRLIPQTATQKIIPPDYVRPKIITLIRNGIKPRKVIRLLLNKRNSASIEQVLSALTESASLDSGAVRKVFTLSGRPVTSLVQFFDTGDVFFVYGNERVLPDDFELEFEESKAIHQHKKTPGLRNGGGPKPKMPNKTKNRTYISEENLFLKLNKDGVSLPDYLAQKYTCGKMIGEGNFAIVKLCLEKETNFEYALKMIDKSKCQGKVDMVENEVRILRKLNHPNIMKLIDEEDTKPILYLVCEYVQGGDLFDAITQVHKFSEEQSALMITHLTSALAYLHNINVVHRDVKPENLLVDFRDNKVRTLKLGDFGLACEVNEPLYTVCGTPTYVAPEILAESGYGLKIDVWAAGVILYILLVGYPPFISKDNDQEKLFDSILSGQYDFPDEYWHEVSDMAKELITNMLQLAPELRFSAEDVLDYPWLSIVES